MVICVAAGNEGADRDGDGIVDPSSITPPANAKNCITIGATQNNRPNVSRPYGILPIFRSSPLATRGWSDNPMRLPPSVVGVQLNRVGSSQTSVLQAPPFYPPAPETL